MTIKCVGRQFFLDTVYIRNKMRYGLTNCFKFNAELRHFFRISEMQKWNIKQFFFLFSKQILEISIINKLIFIICIFCIYIIYILCTYIYIIDKQLYCNNVYYVRTWMHRQFMYYIDISRFLFIYFANW